MGRRMVAIAPSLIYYAQLTKRCLPALRHYLPSPLSNDAKQWRKVIAPHHSVSGNAGCSKGAIRRVSSGVMASAAPVGASSVAVPLPVGAVGLS
jgi:hypothetical protein